MSDKRPLLNDFSLAVQNENEKIVQSDLAKRRSRENQRKNNCLNLQFNFDDACSQTSDISPRNWKIRKQPLII